jgi:hypothetical protein
LVLPALVQGLELALQVLVDCDSSLRFLDPAALARFLAGAGFAIEAQYGGWAREPAARRAPRSFVARHPLDREYDTLASASRHASVRRG